MNTLDGPDTRERTRDRPGASARNVPRNRTHVQRLRGHFQRGLVNVFLRDGELPADVARLIGGKALSYRARYQRSLDTVLDALRADGHALEYVPGPRGGNAHAVWRVVAQRPEQA